MIKHQQTNIAAISVLVFLTVASFFVHVSSLWFLGLVVAWLTITIVGSFRIASNFHIRAYCNNPLEKRKRIAITFDDGPTEHTEQILDVLKRHQVPAAFFCIGRNIENRPGTLRRIFEDGHLIGNHTYSHSALFDFYRKKRVVQEIRKTDELINSICGESPVLFRPPFGVTNPSIRRAIAETSHKVIGWNIRSLDGILKDEDLIFKRVVRRVSPGSVILLHDTSVSTVYILEKLLVFLANQHYTIVPLAQLLDIHED